MKYNNLQIGVLSFFVMMFIIRIFMINFKYMGIINITSLMLSIIILVNITKQKLIKNINYKIEKKIIKIDMVNLIIIIIGFSFGAIDLCFNILGAKGTDLISIIALAIALTSDLLSTIISNILKE